MLEKAIAEAPRRPRILRKSKAGSPSTLGGDGPNGRQGLLGPAHLGQDIVRGRCPDKWLRGGIVLSDISVDGFFEFWDGPENASADAVLRDVPKNRSTLLSHEELVGVKWTWTLGCFSRL